MVSISNKSLTLPMSRMIVELYPPQNVSQVVCTLSYTDRVIAEETAWEC